MSGEQLACRHRSFPVRVPLIDLLGDEVDITPGRRTAPNGESYGVELALCWKELVERLADVADHVRDLSELDLDAGTPRTTTTAGDLGKAGALTPRTGQWPSGTAVLPGEVTVPLLTVSGLLMDGIPAGEFPSTRHAPSRRRAASWAPEWSEPSEHGHTGPPMTLGARLHVLRADQERLGACFLAGCLCAPPTGAGRALMPPAPPGSTFGASMCSDPSLENPMAYPEASQRLGLFEEFLTRADGPGRGLVNDTGDRLAAGGLLA